MKYDQQDDSELVFKTCIPYILTFLIFMIIFPVLNPGISSALESGEINILSEYGKVNKTDSLRSRKWNVSVKKDETNKKQVLFYSENGADIVCEVTVSEGKHIVLKSMNRSGTLQSDNGLLLVGGYPVPADIIEVPCADRPTTHVMRKSAGNRVFKLQYTVSCEQVSLEKAKKNNWLKMNFKPETKFQLFIVRDRKEKTVLKQLRSIDYPDFWVYEETPYRKSWRTK